MNAVADGLAKPGPSPRELWLTIGLSVLLHGLLTLGVVLMPRLQFGHYITVPVTYTVNLVSDPGPAGRGAPAATPASQTPPAPVPAPAPVPRAAAPPPARPSDELTLPTKRPRVEAKLREPEPSLRPQVSRAVPPRPVPTAPAVPGPAPATAGPPVVAPAPAAPVASAKPGSGAAQGSGIEVADAGSGSGGSTLGYYLTLVDRKIRDNWVPLGAAAGPETFVAVRFRVLPSGQVRDIEMETGSGNASIDASAVRAIRQSLPLPPFPNLLTEKSLDLRYKFVMER